MQIEGQITSHENIVPFSFGSYWVKYTGFPEAHRVETSIQVRVDYSTANYSCYCTVNKVSEVSPTGWQKINFALDCNCFPQDSLLFYQLNIRIQVVPYYKDVLGPGTIWVDHLEFSSTPPITAFIKPKSIDHFLAGKKDTIKWNVGMAGQKAKLLYSTDDGANYSLLADNIPADTGMYIWDIPDTLLTAKAKVKLTDQNTGDILAESDKFLIKPYSFTRLESNGELTEYNIWSDAWGFENDKEDVWPDWYYDQFDYLGFDPLTNLPYDTVFIDALPEDFPSWQNFTGAFSVGKCYDNVMTGIYNQKASTTWKSKKGRYGGACFGIAASNALAFESKNDFLSNFPEFGNFAAPFSVSPSVGTVATVTELFTHQYGNPSIYNDIAGNGLKTPTQTIEDIKKMFSTAHTEIRTITMYNNGGSGAHTILPYKLEQDTLNEQYYYIYVYDNEIPDSVNARIRIDVSANGGKGSWEPLYGWSGWGGDRKLYLEIPSTYYYVNATLKKAANYYSLLDSLIEISPNDSANIRIKEVSGKTIGYSDSQLFEEILGTYALMHKDGSKSPPYSYLVPEGEYTIDISNPENKTAEGYIFTKDQLFYYERKNAMPEQTDRLIYDGSLTAINPDDEDRNIKMKLILEQEEEEDVFKLQPFKLGAGDSVKVESPDNNHVILSNYGSAKQYGVELNHVSYSGYERFIHDSIPIKANTSHIFDINWTDVEESLLTIYVDNEMNGSYEDTLLLNYHVTGVDDKEINSLIADLDLKVWPNPAEDKITFSYRLNSGCKISIKIFDNLGNEIMVPLNVKRQKQGKHNLPVNIAELSAGIYYYHFIVNNYKVNGKIIKL
jgi:hypothetical protein